MKGSDSGHDLNKEMKQKMKNGLQSQIKDTLLTYSS